MDAFRTVGGTALSVLDGAVRGARGAWAASQGAATLGGLTPREYYGLLWQFYLNSVYLGAPNEDPFRVLDKYIVSQDLYINIHGIFNPTMRLVEFYVANIFGGRLDKQAGDGSRLPTAIPILTENESIRPALANLWRWSNWSIKKSLLTRYGVALGNVGLMPIDDLARQQVILDVIPPWEVTGLQLDLRGNVIYWRQSYTYLDGEGYTRLYTIEIDKERFRTYRDERLFAYDGNPGSEWSNPYGFVPVVWIKHKEAGGDLGLCAFHSTIPKINNLNDQASHLADQIKKLVHVQWLLTGTQEPSSGTFQSADGSVSQVWSTTNPDAKAIPLNDQFDIGGVVDALKAQMDEIKEDHPELTFAKIREKMGGSGDMPARAVRLALHDAVTLVEEARVQYEDGLTRAQQMALTIGGLRKYKDFEAFDLDSYERGEIDHQIGVRDVVPLDEFDLVKLGTDTAGLGNQLTSLEQATGRPLGEIVPILLDYLARVRSGANIGQPGELKLISPEQAAKLEREQAATETGQEGLDNG